ncbi:MAG: class I SAM-dependent methyltransferase [Anaerolineae bacterium]
MNSTILLLILAVVLALAAILLWWLLIATEGVYLGRRIVTWLYDVYANRYDSIKAYVPDWEQWTLAEPIHKMLSEIDQPLILDVATGTARLPAAVLTASEFDGTVIGLDRSAKMLDMAAQKLNADRRVSFVLSDAVALPFHSDTFDLVCCLEALEFVPDQWQVIAEIVRVTHPGGAIAITNRKGWQRWLYPFRTQDTQRFVRELQRRFDLDSVTPTLWQMDYDLIWAMKGTAKTS